MNQTYRGRFYYASHLQAGAYRLLVAVPCRIGDLKDSIHARFDGASANALSTDELPDHDGAGDR